jgi:hypothetical protein
MPLTKKACDIIDFIVTKTPINLNRSAINPCGSLNEELIGDICNDHGIYLENNVKSKGADRLNDTRNKRNQLAHGQLSFSDCGRDYSLANLKEIKQYTYNFLTEVLKRMKTYYDNQGYLNTSKI